MASLDELDLDSETYMGWEITGEAKLMPLRSYTCYAWPADESPGFSFQIIGERSAGEGGAREQAKKAALEIVKAKVFLGTWLPGGEYARSLEDGISGPGSGLGVRERILNGLYRLWSDGVDPESIRLDLDGIAMELGVTRGQIDRQMELLVDLGAVADIYSDGDRLATLADMDWRDGWCWITSKGAVLVEASSQPSNDYFGGVIRQLAADLATVETTLGARLDEAASIASSTKGSQGDRVAFGNRIRDLIYDITDVMVQRASPNHQFNRNETKNKVREICRSASSNTAARQIEVLADVTEVHWSRLNDLVQAATHDRPISEHKLLIYAVMFLTDLMEVHASVHIPSSEPRL